MNPDNIITGEKLQQLADIYFANSQTDFEYNPLIRTQTNKHKLIVELTTPYDNPRICFCYSHCLKEFSQKVNLFTNDFILITHNSDHNLEYDSYQNQILNSPKLIRWYGQNVCFYNPKLQSIPIGLSNSQWSHGNLQYFENSEYIQDLHLHKTHKVYFQFSLNTNFTTRLTCYEKLKTKYDFLDAVPHQEYLERISKYEFCICPEGNGVDTHRLWEALYLQSIPIVLNSPFIKMIKYHINPPMIILESWDDLSPDKLDYSILQRYKPMMNITINYYRELIMNGNIQTQPVFDIVIPVGPNDADIIKNQLIYTKQNIIGYRNIYIILYNPTIQLDNCIIIDEKSFPFKMNDIVEYYGNNDRNGWYLQQLLKLYAGFIIPNILNTYLVIDSDTFFIKPTHFIENNMCLYNSGTEYHKPYFEHMKQLYPSLHRVYDEFSGISHHMIFETKYLKDLFGLVEKRHNKPFYNVFLESVDPNQIIWSGASEYEIYFNYMLIYHSSKIILRQLKWKNATTLDVNSDNDYISYHHYNRLDIT
jgi:hypothetical protein